MGIKNNDWLMIVLAFIAGYCLWGTMKNMPRGELVEGLGVDLYCGHGQKKLKANSIFDIGHCVDCPRGTYNHNNDYEYSTCTECPLGHYQDETGESYCKTCDLGSTTDGPGKTDCKICLQGYYKGVSDSGKSACIKCDPGYTTGGKSADGTKNGCNACPKGKFESKGKCESCPPGKYQDEEGQTDCKPCSDPSKGSNDDKTECVICPEGRYKSKIPSVGWACTKCSPGKYQDKVGQTTCMPCPGSTTYSLEGATECQQCEDGYQPNKERGGCEACLGSYSQENYYMNTNADGERLFRQMDSSLRIKGWGYAGTGGKCSPCAGAKKYGMADNDASSTCSCIYDPKMNFDPTGSSGSNCPPQTDDMLGWQKMHGDTKGVGIIWDNPAMPHRNRDKEISRGQTKSNINKYFKP